LATFRRNFDAFLATSFRLIGDEPAHFVLIDHDVTDDVISDDTDDETDAIKEVVTLPCSPEMSDDTTSLPFFCRFEIVADGHVTPILDAASVASALSTNADARVLLRLTLLTLPLSTPETNVRVSSEAMRLRKSLSLTSFPRSTTPRYGAARPPSLEKDIKWFASLPDRLRRPIARVSKEFRGIVADQMLRSLHSELALPLSDANADLVLRYLDVLRSSRKQTSTISVEFVSANRAVFLDLLVRSLTLQSLSSACYLLRGNVSFAVVTFENDVASVIMHDDAAELARVESIVLQCE